MYRLTLFVFIASQFFLGSCSKSGSPTDVGNPAGVAITGFSPASGKENSIVTITGSGFGNDQSRITVKFNDVFVSTIKSISNTQLVVQVPIQATTGKIQVSTAPLVADSTTNDFTVTSSYQKMADFGGGIRNLATAVVIGNKAYAGLGADAVNGYKLDWWEFDPATNVWTRKADFPGTGRVEAASFSVGSKGYIFGGQTSAAFFNDIWEYDPAADKWTQKTALPALGRSGAFGFSTTDKGYIVAGYYGSGATGDYYSKNVWEYNPSNNGWTLKNDFPAAGRSQGYAFKIGADNYIGGGASINSAGQPAEHPDLYKYNSADDSWISKTGLGLMGYSNCAVSLNNKGYVLTGYSENDFGVAGVNVLFYTGQAFGYDPATDKWTREPYYPGYSRSAAIGFTVANRGFVGTGYGSPIGSGSGVTLLKDIWEFVPQE